MTQYLVGYHRQCGCVTAGMVLDEKTKQRDIGQFIKNVTSTGRSFRVDDTPPTLQHCSHSNGPREP